MVDPWDVDDDADGAAALADTPETRTTRDAIERALGAHFSARDCDECSIRELLSALRAAGCRYRRAQVEPILHAMDRERDGPIMYREGIVHLI